MIISSIVASDINGAIGKDGDIPWHLPADLKYFKRTTMKHPIIMGRKCYESIGRPLPGRDNIIITRRRGYQAPGCEIYHSIDEAYQQMILRRCEEVFVIGGGEIYSQTEAHWDQLYWTLVHTEVSDADTWFKLERPELWDLVWTERHESDEKNTHSYTFQKFLRQ